MASSSTSADKILAHCRSVDQYIQHRQLWPNLCGVRHGKLLPSRVHPGAAYCLARWQIPIHGLDQEVRSRGYGDSCQGGLGWERSQGGVSLEMKNISGV
jgi:hypothetical protein